MSNPDQRNEVQQRSAPTLVEISNPSPLRQFGRIKGCFLGVQGDSVMDDKFREELIKLLSDLYDSNFLECYDAGAHRAGTCLDRRVKSALHRLELDKELEKQ